MRGWGREEDFILHIYSYLPWCCRGVMRRCIPSRRCPASYLASLLSLREHFRSFLRWKFRVLGAGSRFNPPRAWEYPVRTFPRVRLQNKDHENSLCGRKVATTFQLTLQMKPLAMQLAQDVAAVEWGRSIRQITQEVRRKKRRKEWKWWLTKCRSEFF